MNIKIVLLNMVFLLSVSGPLYAQPALSQSIDSLVASYEEKDLFSGSILVARSGEVFSAGYGMANRSWDIPNSPETRFRIASLTKPFTAMLVLQLVEQGSLSLDDLIVQYLPDFPAEYVADVTIRHLLSHTSGIPSYTNFTNWVDTTSRVNVQPASFTELIASKELAFEPGTGFRYSNSNYYLLGVIIEKVTGMSYSRVLQEQVLDPGRLGDTGYQFNGMIIEQMAEGYERISSDYYEKAPYQSPSTAYAAGGIYSAVHDLYQWEQLLYSDRLLMEETRQQMMTPREGNYGYGWIAGEAYVDEVARFLKSPFDFSTNSRPEPEPYRLVWHRGSHPGFNSLLVRVPDPRWTIIILENQQLNGDPVGTKIYDIAGEIFSILDGRRQP
ncbi:serine hydrolase domain-containing protein [Halalkalibaculum sp. DA384]|uniref:serine hydrolase domain-containing protein n=1 Tax=Halalkalibaculum sp. DA384 TaxID=3373606 RepID=UPI0037550096